jgi:outer membrane protein assembly factor BamB
VPRRTVLILSLATASLVLMRASTVSAIPSSTAERSAPGTSFSDERALPRPSGQWSMFMNGPQRRGWTPIVGAQTSTLAWRISTETNYGGPVIGRDGTIYQGTFAGQLLALNPDGTTNWIVSVPYIVESTPAILLDGRIAFADDGGYLNVVNPDGSFSWRHYTGNVFQNGSPAIGADGTIYTTGYRRVRALSPNGTFLWSFKPPISPSPVAVGPGGVVYFISGGLIALARDGSLLWQSSQFVGSTGAPTVASDGTIYVNGNPATVYAFYPDGTLKWSYQVDSCCSPDVSATPALGQDGTIYVGEYVSTGGVMVALNPDGSLKWRADLGTSPTAAAIGGDGTIYFGSGSHNPSSLYALNPDGTLKWQYDDPSGAYVRTPPAIGLGHRVYAGSGEGLFAIGP